MSRMLPGRRRPCDGDREFQNSMRKSMAELYLRSR